MHKITGNELTRIERERDNFFFFFFGQIWRQNEGGKFNTRDFGCSDNTQLSSHTRESIFQLFTTLPHKIHHSHTHSHAHKDRETESAKERTRWNDLVVVGIFSNRCVVVRKRWGTAIPLLWEVAEKAGEFFIVNARRQQLRAKTRGKRQRA